MKEQDPIQVRDATVSSALVSCSVVCPMCGLAGTQYRLNPRQYWHTGREVDLQPIGYRFRDVAKGVHPPLLAMWHCMGCYFTAEAVDFQAPLKDVLIRTDTVAFALKELARTDSHFDRVIQTLHAGVYLDVVDFFQAVKLHILAFRIWDEIGGMVKQDYLTQAKYCLLLGWLYRDLQAMKATQAATLVRVEQLTAELQHDWPGLPVTEEAALRKAINYYEDSLAINTFSKDPINEVMALHRIGRLQMKLGEYLPARETFRRSTIQAQAAARAIHRQLGFRGNSPGREELTGAAREAAVDRGRRLESIINDEGRLSDTIRDLLAGVRARSLSG